MISSRYDDLSRRTRLTRGKKKKTISVCRVVVYSFVAYDFICCVQFHLLRTISFVAYDFICIFHDVKICHMQMTVY